MVMMMVMMMMVTLTQLSAAFATNRDAVDEDEDHYHLPKTDSMQSCSGEKGAVWNVIEEKHESTAKEI